MNVAEQEALFKQVVAKFGGMSNRWHSGYIAGVVDADKGESPGHVALDEDYDEGYCSGYFDAEGIDALHLYPAILIDLCKDDLEYRWWEQE